MKILNLYAGIGGNRKNWSDHHEITAVEIDPLKAEIYNSFFPGDNVVIADAHKYLLEHFKEFDFIWASPPCPTHSSIKKARVKNKSEGYSYPDMKLYQEIIFLEAFFEGDYAVENVNPYYDELIDAQKVGRHLIWSNFSISDIEVDGPDIENASVSDLEEAYGFDLSSYEVEHDKKRKMLRNCVHPEIGDHVLKSRNSKQSTLPEVELELEEVKA